jgi:hypothetical protein
MYKTLNQTKQDKCRKFLHEIARGWIMEQGDTADSSNDDDNSVPSGKRSAPRGSSLDPPGRLLGDFSRHKSRKMVCAGQGKANILQDNVGFCTQIAE